MNVKCAFFDIDGTLIEPTKGIFKVRKEHEAIFRALQANNIKVVSATGRQLNSLRVATPFKFDANICLNGAMIHIDNHLIEKTTYTPSTIQSLWSTLVAHDIDFVMQGESVYYYHHKNSDNVSKYIELVLMQKDTKAYYGFPKHDIYKVSVFLSNQTQKDSLIKELSFEHNLMFYSSHLRQSSAKRLNGEITQKDVHKGKGVKTVLNLFNIDPSEAIAFGDNANDVEMFKLVRGYAMSDATKELKQHAFKVIDDVTTFTIIDELKALKII